MAPSRHRVLLAEDSQGARLALVAMLRRHGYDVDSVENGAEALERLRAQPGAYALVISDLAMPVMDGNELVRAIALLPAPRPPVLLVSGHDVDADIHARYLAKPFTPSELGVAVASLLAPQASAPTSFGD
jgi:CheY-like chemotaxis protein